MERKCNLNDIIVFSFFLTFFLFCPTTQKWNNGSSSAFLYIYQCLHMGSRIHLHKKVYLFLLDSITSELLYSGLLSIALLFWNRNWCLQHLTAILVHKSRLFCPLWKVILVNCSVTDHHGSIGLYYIWPNKSDWFISKIAFCFIFPPVCFVLYWGKRNKSS